MNAPLSLEFFPPKTPEGSAKLRAVRQELYRLKPEFCSVTYGAGGSTHLAGELFRHLSGIKMTHVSYRGASPATNDAVASQIPVAIQDSMSVSAFIASGQLRPIAVTSATQRSWSGRCSECMKGI